MIADDISLLLGPFRNGKIATVPGAVIRDYRTGIPLKGMVSGGVILVFGVDAPLIPIPW
jgi:hypothetical protein